MAREKKSLAKTAAALAATALLERAIRMASEDPRVRRKAKTVGKALKKRARAAGKKIAKAVKKRSPKARRAAQARARKRVRAGS